MPHYEKPPPEKVMELVECCKAEKIILIVSCDANAHHTIWGSSDTNGRGLEVLDYLAGERLAWCNRGPSSTFVTRGRREVLDHNMRDW